MRFKYYLRGAGIGVMVATLVLSIAFLFHDNISDEEVIRRAMKLGMVMQDNTPGTLADTPLGGVSSVDPETGTDEDTLSESNQNQDSENEDSQNQDSENQNEGNQNSGNQDSENEDSKNQNADDPDRSTAAGDKPESDERTDPPAEEDHTGQKSDEEDKNKDKDKDSKPPKKNPQADSDEVEIVIESGDVSRMVSAKVFEAGLVEDADEFNSFLGSNDYDNQLQPGTYKIKKGSDFRQIAEILTRQ
uniref:YceG-like family protein n=1 Tax=Eubacterium plexicaudatum ASF492 TaxID=1235802 RepID=N2BBG4_9FIRM